MEIPTDIRTCFPWSEKPVNVEEMRQRTEAIPKSLLQLARAVEAAGEIPHAVGVAQVGSGAEGMPRSGGGGRGEGKSTRYGC